MSHSSSTDSSTGGVFSKLWWVLPPLLMGFLAITGQSFWIDECMTARFVAEPTLAAWWHDMRTTTYPEAQMPLYLLYLWGWDKLCGHSEWSLRLAALPWFVPGVAAFLYSLRRIGHRGVAVILVTCSSAFLWYYLNEARLYAMQAAVSCLIFAALAECQSSSQNPSRLWVFVLVVGILLLSAISIIGMVWASAAIIVVWGLFPVSTLKQCGLRYRILIAAVVGLLGLLAAYYVSTVSRGAKATMIGTTNWQTVAFILYEQLGFTGLGPGRAELRERGVHALVRYWPLIGLYAIALVAALFAGLKVVWQSPIRHRALWIVAGIGVPVAFFLVAGMLAHFRVLGRHLTPLIPVWLCLLSLGLVWLWRSGLPGRTAVALFLVLSLASAFEMRWSVRHVKDDYRSAVAFSKAALDAGRSVWWNASHEAATHYGLPLTGDPKQAGRALLIFNPLPTTLAQLPLPDVVAITKPDIYDQDRIVMNFLTQSGYQPRTNFPAFVIWGRNR